MSIDRVSQQQRPPGRPAGFQRWRNLLFLHWEIDVAHLQSKLPEGLEVDTYDGKAYIGVVPFTMRDVAPWWAPPVPGISHFHELNVRTYVLHKGEPGVWFFSLEAAASIAVIAARTGWKLPYHRASMSMAINNDDVHYRSKRLWPGPKPATFEARYTLGQPIASAAVGTLDHFFVERYLLFSELKPGLLQKGIVHHVSYPLRQVTVHEVDEQVAAAAGLERADHPPIAHYSDGVDVDVFALRPIT